MSVMPVSVSLNWRQSWPLWLLMGLLVCAGLLVWYFWPQILLQSVWWQKALHQQMTALLQQVASNPRQAGLALAGFSLLYGILHALGPGHGKVVIATFLATHPTRIKTSLQLTLAASIVQGGVAIALVTVMLVVLQLSSRQLHLSSWWLEKSSYLLVAGLGIWLCWRALVRLRQALHSADTALVVKSVAVLSSATEIHHHSHSAVHKPLTGGQVAHQHSAHCGCGHQHLPDAGQLAAAVGWKTKLMVVLSMGLRPCSGAIMMLLFSKVIGVYAWGVFSALVMAAGTALTVSAMALLVQISRVLAQRLSRNRPQAAWQPVALHCLALCGGLLLIMTGVMLWLTAQPAIAGGIRPLFR